MKKCDSLSLLCQYLQNLDSRQEDSAPTPKVRQKLQPDWHAVARLADQHFVLPLLYQQLVRKRILQLLPEDLQTLLAEIYKLNRLRNDLIYNQINRIAFLFNSAGIEPIFLKGSAALLMELYDDPGLRVMNDVDFLVDKKDLPTCVELMQSMGYYPMEGLKLPEDFYHHPPLVHNSHSIRFEIHERLHTDSVLDSEAIITESVMIKMPDGIVRVPKNTHFTIHNILHHQVFDKNSLNEETPLYQLYDLYMMRERHDRHLDWRSICCFFTNHSLQDPYYYSLDLLRKYFKQRPPEKIRLSVQCGRIYRRIMHYCNELLTSYNLLPRTKNLKINQK